MPRALGSDFVPAQLERNDGLALDQILGALLVDLIQARVELFQAGVVRPRLDALGSMRFERRSVPRRPRPRAQRPASARIEAPRRIPGRPPWSARPGRRRRARGAATRSEFKPMASAMWCAPCRALRLTAAAPARAKCARHARAPVATVRSVPRPPRGRPGPPPSPSSDPSPTSSLPVQPATLAISFGQFTQACRRDHSLRAAEAARERRRRPVLAIVAVQIRPWVRVAREARHRRHRITPPVDDPRAGTVNPKPAATPPRAAGMRARTE